ncbi:MAG: aminopeptidase P N-terminal domain-containing protein [Gemmatimonadota bacterium]|nr:aminopeptidase P N-terminal domain-containing protein [Gemmatimonadota bacterium]
MRDDPLPPLPYGDRRDRVLARLEGASMLLPAAPVRFRNGDSEYPYRPDSELLYMTGWDTPDCIALLRGFADEDRFVLFAPERDPEKELWTGPRREPEEVRALFGTDRVLALREFAEKAPGLLAGGEGIHYRLGANEMCDRVVREALRTGRRERARSGAGPWMVADPGTILDPLRVRKDPAEIARMREAARISVAAFGEALPSVREGAGEWEVQAALEAGFRGRGANGAAFATIVAAGANACTLHYSANCARIGADDLVLVDAGAEFDFYAADITRTVPAAGRLEGARGEVYEVVRDAHGAAVAACVPGGTLDAVHQAAVRGIVVGLVAAGILKQTVDEVLERETYRRFFPHRTSHWLGLDTHDAGPYRDRDGPLRLEPGMVFTVEPGLYFAPGSGADTAGIEGTGIRLEDDVLVTPQGAEVLTAGLPLDPAALAELAGG